MMDIHPEFEVTFTEDTATVRAGAVTASLHGERAVAQFRRQLGAYALGIMRDCADYEQYDAGYATAGQVIGRGLANNAARRAL